MITEHIKLETHPRFLAKKYEIMLPEVMRILHRRANEEKLNAAYEDWLMTGETVKAIAERHEVTLNTLSARINRGFITRERV
jgi:transposase-like protein